jgi:hypothetical protein
MCCLGAVGDVIDERFIDFEDVDWCYRRDYLRTTVGAPARIFGDDFSLGD